MRDPFDMGRGRADHTPSAVYRIFTNQIENVGMVRPQLTAHAAGLAAEDAACAALVADGWAIRARRLRTKAGEIDAVAEKDGLLAIIEVKHRPTLAEAAASLSVRQRGRLLHACDIILADHPEWGRNGVRFDVLVVDAAFRIRRIADAFRAGD
jgi:putative endonuclease